MEETLRVFKVAADATRLRILKILEVKPLCVCEVMSVLGMAQSTTSRHLRLLKDAGLIEEIPGGVWTVYRLVTDPKVPIVGAVLKIMRQTTSAQVVTDQRAAKKVNRERLC